MNLIDNQYSIEELEEYIANEKLADYETNQIVWYIIGAYQNLTESFIDKYAGKFDWSYISWKQKLSEYIIDKYNDRVDWYYIPRYQKLTEAFIDKYIDKVDWDDIVRFQSLSYNFLVKHLYKFSLYIPSKDICANIEHILKLQEVYKDKYEIDKLAYGLNR